MYPPCRKLALLALCGCASPAIAGTVTGEIESIEQIIGLESAGRPFMLVRIVGSVDVAPPACNTSDRFAIDLSTGTGQEAARLVQLLYVAGRTGRIQGTGDCGLYGNSETASEVDAY